jgi:hypothetical protein
MRHLVGMLPAADAAQLGVLVQALQQLPRQGQTVYRFGHKGTGDGQTVFGRTSHPAARGRYETGQRDHFQNSD